MRRRVVMALLALGVVGGYGSGIASLACRRHHWQRHQHQQHVNELARACAEAARAQHPGAYYVAPQGPYAQPFNGPYAAPQQVPFGHQAPPFGWQPGPR